MLRSERHRESLSIISFALSQYGASYTHKKATRL